MTTIDISTRAQSLEARPDTLEAIAAKDMPPVAIVVAPAAYPSAVRALASASARAIGSAPGHVDHLTVLAAIDRQGPVGAAMTVSGGTTSAVFQTYLNDDLLPGLQYHKPDAVIILDNLKAHHNKTAKRMVIKRRRGWSKRPVFLWSTCRLIHRNGHRWKSAGPRSRRSCGPWAPEQRRLSLKPFPWHGREFHPRIPEAGSSTVATGQPTHGWPRPRQDERCFAQNRELHGS